MAEKAKPGSDRYRENQERMEQEERDRQAEADDRARRNQGKK